MKLPNITILESDNKILREISKEVIFPLTKEEKQMIEDMITYLTMSQIEVEREKYNLRAGIGMSSVQVGILKRIFVIVEELDDGNFKNYVVINPKIKSMSEEMIYVGEGEGCLSINRPTEGIVPRHARVTVNAYDIEGNPYSLRVREDISICFQHEIDHLNGILFTDHIDSKNPFKNSDKMREI